MYLSTSELIGSIKRELYEPYEFCHSSLVGKLLISNSCRFRVYRVQGLGWIALSS